QGRRILGDYLFTQREEDPDPETGHPRLHSDSIALANYPWDSHAVHKYDPKFPRMREGYYVVGHPPLQIPYGVIVPKKVDGLLVQKKAAGRRGRAACPPPPGGTQTTRRDRFFRAPGGAAATAAARATAAGTNVRDVEVPRVQAELARRKGVLAYFEDLYPPH